MWTLEGLEGRYGDIFSLSGFSRIDATGVEKLDTYGALVILKLADSLGEGSIVASEEHLGLIRLVDGWRGGCPGPSRRGLGEAVLDWMAFRFAGVISFLDFVGRLFLSCIYHLGDFDARAFFRDIEEMGLRALPIVGVLSFLIGLVIAYQSAVQLARFGANIFIVDLVVLSTVRELAPLIVAVLISGRSASSYTATIGLMRVNDEIDALEVMGVSPYASVALPRIVSLFVITPFLVVFSDVVGIAGGVLVSKLSLGLELGQFLKRMEAVLKPHHFWAGLVKAPVFGLYVGMVGTWKGFTVEKRAESIGGRVIESVVLSIFGVLVIDAVFSVVLRWMGI